MEFNKKGKKYLPEKKRKTDLILKKHVGLIHCENKLTLIQRKICNILLFNAIDRINEQEIHEISQKQLCSLVGYNSNDISLIKDAIRSLISVVMEWNLLDDSLFVNENALPEEVISWNASSLLAGASIKRGIIHYSYSPQIKTVLTSLEIYGRINLFIQSKFNSSYSLVLYENCVRFKNIKQTSWFSLQLFRSLMGVSQGKYASFKEFKRNVITVAVKEINQKSDILIEPQYKKIGRQIVAVQFLISDNENYHPIFKRINATTKPHEHLHQTKIVDILTSQFNLSLKQVKKLLAEYDSQYLLEKINLIRKKENIDNQAAYLIAALKHDYKDLQKNELQQLNKRIENNYYLREYKEASQIGSLKKRYMLYKLKLYKKYIRDQTETIQELIYEGFEAYLKPNSEIFKNYKKKGFFSPLVVAELITFIEQNYSSIIQECLSFDDYITAEEDSTDIYAVS